MQITEAVKQTFLQEIDHLLLRRHRLAPLRLTSTQLSRMFFSPREWMPVAALIKSDATDVLIRQPTVSTVEIDPYGISFNFTLANNDGKSPQIVCLNTPNQPLHWDNEVAPYFRKWVDAQAQIMKDNLEAYGVISKLMTRASTWLQVKKAWPELAQFTKTLNAEAQRNHTYAFYKMKQVPDLRDLDARLARDVDTEVKLLLDKAARRAQKTLLQASFLPPLDDMSQDGEVAPERNWYRYNTRPAYMMHSWCTGPGRSYY